MKIQLVPNTLRSFPAKSRCLLISAAIATGLTAVTANADINSRNQTVWKMQYGVTDAQLASPTWMNADDDGDGISNGTEVASGTNPFSVGSVVKITNITADATTVSLTFPPQKGKQYVVQGGPNLTSFANLSPSVAYVWNPTFLTPAPVLPSSVTLTAPKGSNKFFRVLVQDLDSDGDGVSDWAEYVVGYNPNDSTSVGSTPDGTGLDADIVNSQKVSILATDSTALQPDAGSAAVDVGQLSVVREGSLKFSDVFVNLTKSGSAVEGTDYSALPTQVKIPAKSSSVTLDVMPVANAGLKTNRVATVSVAAGGGYSLGSKTSASVAINPAGKANGTGLTAVYQNTASATYSTQTGIFATSAEMTRTDATVDFSSGVNGWGAVAGPTGLSSPSTTGAFSVRWAGQVLPQYSETYTIDFRSDDGAKVWVNGVLLIDRWNTQSANDYTNTIDLKAGTLYDIQIEYFNNATGSAEAKLYWWSASQVKQIIPQTRLFPAPAQSAKFTAITSSLAAVGYVGVPFSFNVTSPNIGGTTTYALASGSGPLPAGLTLNASTGLISGSPTTAGTSNVAVDATNSAAGTVTGSSIINFTIWPTGIVTRETLAGATVTADGTVSTLDDDTDYPNNTSRRLRGYIVPPKTGNYYFWLAANNTAEFWLSNDSESVNAIRRASVTASTGKKVWNALASQQSQWLYLVGGQKYYFEVLHNTGADADDYVSLGWLQDDVGTIISTSAFPNPNGITPIIANGGAALQGYPFSGTAPSYIFQPYDYPTAASATGTLYAANLGPQGAATTKASGSANLRVDMANNSAVLHFSYSGLSTPRTNYHLHVDAFDTHPAGEIVYDIDDVDAFHPELRTADGGYIWNFAPGGTFSTVQQIKDAITGGKVYLNIHTVSYPNGEIRGNLNLVDGSQNAPLASNYPEPATTDVATNAANAARFLNQASFGASPTEVSNVASMGFSGWINDQLTKPASRSSNDVVAGITADINQPYPSALFTNAWWKYSITGQDQLRQRLAFALSEIMVVSWANDSGPLAFNGRILADYYDQLVDYCLPTAGLTDSGNFRGILKQVTLTPAMGLYLDMRANQKGDDSTGLHPNENYAREIMQLFSIGLNRMWDDGKFVIDSNANLVPTYTQPTILGLSALLTGWNYNQALQASGRLPTSFSPGADYLNPMVLVPTKHENRYTKLLLNNVVSPAATGFTPRVSISSITTGNPCTVNTSTMHGLKVGDTVAIAGVTGGTFPAGLAAINATHQVVAVPSATSFTVAVQCTANAGAAGTVTGAKVTPVAYVQSSGMAAVTGSQADNAGTTVPHPYDQYGMKELDMAIDNIVNNDNTAPYICRQLIQRLVTSDPSPGYVYRVVQKFKNNGSGVRGDMVAVIKQILLDGEARSTTAAFANSNFGKQREPMLRVTGPARAFPSTAYTGTFTQLTGVNSNKLRITTSAPNDFSTSSTVSLNFQGNYVTPQPSVPNPVGTPTSTTYSVAGTTSIASTYVDVTNIAPSASTIFTTSGPHGLANSNVIWLFGLSGKFSDASINSGGKAITIDSPTSFHLTTALNTTAIFQIQSVAVGTPCIVTTVAPHGLPAGTTTGVTINGVNGGAFSASINGTNMTVVNTGANTFTVTGVNCTSPPTSYTTWRMCSNPCRVTTIGNHGLTTGDTVTISGVSGGSFSPTINGTYSVNVLDPTSFIIPSVSCISPSTNNTGTIVGASVLEVAATGMSNVSYTQTAGSNTMTVNTGGPQTDVPVPNPNSATTTLKSKVYLKFLTRNSTANIASIATGNPCTITTATPHGLVGGETVTISGVSGGTFTPTINSVYSVTFVSTTQFRVTSNCTVAPTANTGVVNGDFGGTPADGIYDVQTNPTASSFTVTTADTPAATRNGNVIVPKISTSYTPLSSNTIVQYNNNVNHNMSVNDHVWVDVPIITSPVTDAEYVITETADEDHFKTSYLPVTSGLSTTFPKPSGSNNGITIYPLVSPPLGRSGSVVINQSTFSIGSTESSLSQSPMNAPTVFNFFFPDYKFPGALSAAGVDSPEFQLSTDTNLSNLTNSVTNMFVGTGGGNGNVNGLSSFNNGGGGIVFDIGNHLANTADGSISGLIDTLAGLLVGAPLETSTKTTISDFVTYKRTITNISQASPCVITMSSAHGLSVGNQIAINDVTGGTYSGGSTAINGSFKVTEVVSATQIKIGTAVTTPVAINCTNNSTINYTNANVSNFPMNIPAPGPTNLQRRDRVRAIIHLILTSAEYAVQK